MTENYDKLKAQKDAIIAKQTVGTLHAHNEHQSTCPHCRFANSEALVVEARAQRLVEALRDALDWIRLAPDDGQPLKFHELALSELRRKHGELIA